MTTALALDEFAQRLADHLPVYVHEWHLAVAEGRSLAGLLP